MLILCIILSILLFTSLGAIVVIGIEESWDLGEWLGTLCFIFIFPLWLIEKTTRIIGRKYRMYKARKKKTNKENNK